MTRLLAALTVLSLAAPASAAEWTIDKAHSSIGFSVRHMVISKTKGEFEKFDGTIHYEPGKPKTWKATAEIDVASINTKNQNRDDHLRSPDFFNVKEHPKMTFVSKDVKKVKGDKAWLVGDLTIRGITKEVTLELENHGIVKGPWGKTRTGWTATTTINRFDFDVKWSKKLDTGKFVVGEEVDITIEIEAIKKED